MTAWIRRLSTVESARLAMSGVDGPLAGVPFAIKDNLDLAGYPTTAACPALSEPAREHATAVRRLIEAGAVPAGKTNLDQFATGLVGTRTPYGACHSVFSPAHISGGSSAGSAVAVATGEVPLALGTDTAGSGRVPAACNGIVGVKPTRGLVSTRGLLPACRALDCVTTFTRTVAEGRDALGVLAGFDPDDVYSRPAPPLVPAVARRMRVLAVPDRPLGLDAPHEAAWQAALWVAARVATHLVPVDVSALLECGRMLYGGAYVAARWAAFGHLLDLPDVDPTVRRIVSAGRDVSGADVFTAADRLLALRRRADLDLSGVDALLLPTTPGHPTLAEVAADPIGVNARLGTFTTFANLLDMCAVAVPAGTRADGLPFGVQLIGPAFADAPLLDLASRWCGEAVPDPGGPPGTVPLAVVGAHLSGLPLNPQLIELGGRLDHRARTAGGYRLYRLPGSGLPRPGLVWTGDGPASGIAVEVWRLPQQGAGALLSTVPAPLGLGRVRLDDGTEVPGFCCPGGAVNGAADITGYGGWRRYLAAAG